MLTSQALRRGPKPQRVASHLITRIERARTKSQSQFLLINVKLANILDLVH